MDRIMSPCLEVMPPHRKPLLLTVTRNDGFEEVQMALVRAAVVLGAASRIPVAEGAAEFNPGELKYMTTVPAETDDDPSYEWQALEKKAPPPPGAYPWQTPNWTPAVRRCRLNTSG